MPRDGSGIYSKPFPDVVPGTTIESAVFNGNTADVEQDLNAARPIVAGGTGATSAEQARVNLQAEAAAQLVTNYDSHVWMPGSFRSAVGATGAPNADNAFAGVCYIGEALAYPPTNQNVVVEARDLGDDSVPGIVYVREKLAGVWSAWEANPSSSDAVMVDADQTFTEAQKAQGRENIYAAPFDALAYNGMQINGSMEVSQEFGTSGTAVSGQHPADGWRQYYQGGMVVFAFQAIASIGGGLPAFVALTPTTAKASLAASDLTIFFQDMEGYRVNRLNWGAASAQPLTIAFWSSHSRVGVYSVSFRNRDQNRSYVAAYTHAAADTAQYNVITVPGASSGVWEKSNLAGINISFVMAAGSTFTAPTVNTWHAGNYISAPGQVNNVATTSDVFRITGVVVLPGIEAPSAERSALIMRPYDQELVTCMRYYQKISNPPGAGVTNGSLLLFGWSFPLAVPMRATPTALMTGNVDFTTPTAGFSATSVSISQCTFDTWMVRANINVATPNGTAVAVGNGLPVVVDARL